jgi:hypothetical protein
MPHNKFLNSQLKILSMKLWKMSKRWLKVRTHHVVTGLLSRHTTEI